MLRIGNGRHCISAIKQGMAFFSRRSKRCHRRTRLTLPEGGSSPSGLPLTMPSGMVRGAAPPPKCTAHSCRAFMATPSHLPSDLATQMLYACRSATVWLPYRQVRQRGELLALPFRSPPRQGSIPCTPLIAVLAALLLPFPSE